MQKTSLSPAARRRITLTATLRRLVFALGVALSGLLHPLYAFAQDKAPSAEEVIGYVSPPPGTQTYIDEYSQTGQTGIALIFFISNLIRVATIVAGIWVVFNVVWAGYLYLTSSGKSQATEKVRNLLTMSVIGLLLILTAYTVAGLIGLIIFGDASYIINPQLPKPGSYFNTP